MRRLASPLLFAAGIRSQAFDNGGETLLNGSQRRRFKVGCKRGEEGENALATTVEAPMVGKILKIEKQVGDRVEEDDVVIVMEAMKMEIPVVAPASGTLKELKVTVGQAVDAEQTLAVID
jgi:acetyl-CoA carboxylase biotin carboxyl carrier protein